MHLLRCPGSYQLHRHLKRYTLGKDITAMEEIHSRYLYFITNDMNLIATTNGIGFRRMVGSRQENIENFQKGMIVKRVT